ncbi:MAG: hypothetical protein A2X58_10080 [Nitrospirae bacterium GWC2_56_14]|nr:MAG: hypothetical protein A2X58_10080 [Nitrospirae bacterium GWC2_56_14]
MRTILFFMLFSFLFLAQESRAGEVRAIELKDGSIVTGEVVSLINGKYTIRSASLGTVLIEESKVRVIRPVAAPAAANSALSNNNAGDVRALQDRMMNDKEIMSKIEALQNDPEFMKILEDPEVMKAVTSGDTAALMANPQFLKLMNNPTVRDIEQKVR